MISSEEEFLLLAKKWQNESKTVVVLGAINGDFAYFHVRGKVNHINEHEKSISIAADNETWVVINYANCGFGFDTSDDKTHELIQMRGTLPEDERFDDTIGIVSSHAAIVWILSVAQESP